MNLYYYSFSSQSHAWTVAPVAFTWQCVFNDNAYNVNHMLLFPEATVQLTLDDDTAVHFPYRSAQWTEFTLYLYHHTTQPTTNKSDKFVIILSAPTLSNGIKPLAIFSVLLPPTLIVFPQSPPLPSMVAPVKTCITFIKLEFFILYVLSFKL